MFVILHAATDLQDEDILLTMQLKMSKFHSPGLDAMVRRLPCLTRRMELLTIDAIVDYLPETIRPRIEACVQDITQAQDHFEQVPTNHSNVMKSGFAIALSAMCCERGLGADLGHRLNSWIDELVHWYPPTDENWSYVPSPGPWAPGDEPPPGLIMTLSVISSKPETHSNPWLRPERICWGWNVMEEEGVRVPLEVEQFCNGLVEAQTEEGAIGFLLYCKQYA